MSIKLPTPTPVDVPVMQSGRSAEPNPFDPIVKELNKARGTARAFVFPYKTDDDKAEVKRAKNAAHRAGRSADVSVRARVAEDAKKGTATLTVWVVDKITRSRNEASSLAEEIDPVPSKNTGA